MRGFHDSLRQKPISLFILVGWSSVWMARRWRRYIPPKHRLTQDLHSAISPRMTFFILTFSTYSFVTSEIHTILIQCFSLRMTTWITSWSYDMKLWNTLYSILHFIYPHVHIVSTRLQYTNTLICDLMHKLSLCNMLTLWSKGHLNINLPLWQGF
jgi:hypothetical protein